ncbi:polysaccharide pyruvyl transferase family protein [Ruoffia tabacinasalis]|uniref:polysaccharide pyruvyl transferase family protein n=1 Tax=Ruoffia tabacinasalis TaxID=87458 RepID=UPI0030D40B4E
MKKVTILDTSIATANLGDEIIVDAVENELYKIFNEKTMFFHVPTHERMGLSSYRLIKQSNNAFVGGTNLLSSNYRIVRPNQWRYSFFDTKFIDKNKIVLLGVGWANYENNPGILAKEFYKRAISEKYIHSVRDSYTETKLKSIGIKNVINTGCATMWNFTPEFCSTIPMEKSKNVVFTLTDYRQDKINDQKLINYLEKLYNKVYFWPQGAKDFEYFNSLKHSKIRIINPTLRSFDELLKTESDLDYVGTRLHGGIRALQNRIRTLIIGVDNRATEKKKDFNLNVLDRKQIDRLPEIINFSFETNIKLNLENITDWKSQFY